MKKIIIISITGLLFINSAHAKLDVAPVNNELYKKECGACHMAYQPGFLPARSWKKMMTTLDDHFGENAELDEADRSALTSYMIDNAADHSNYKRSRKIMRSLSAHETPLRITEVSYIRRKHHEISIQKMKNNPKIGSFSRCEACHSRADSGSYSEHEVRIPGARSNREGGGLRSLFGGGEHEEEHEGRERDHDD